MMLDMSELDAAVAQLVEQRTENAWVAGSSPACGTNEKNATLYFESGVFVSSSRGVGYTSSSSRTFRLQA